MTAPSPTAAPAGRTGYLCLLTAVAALGGLLFGYDTAVISGAIGFIQSHFALDAAATGWAASCALAGCVVGAAGAGVISDRLGRWRVLFISGVLFLVSAVGAALAPDIATFVCFRMLGGIGIGAASMASPLYIAEIAPKRWRGRLVAVNQLAIVSGMLLIYLVNYRIAGLGDDAWNETTGWRWMFASGALPSLLLLACLFCVPETPRYLAARGRQAEALRVATSIHGAATAQVELREIGAEAGREGGLDLFTPALRPLLAIGIALAVLQQITGINVFLYYAPEIFKQLGTEGNTALFQTIIVGAVNLLFTLVAMAVVDKAGRKPLMIVGSLGMGACLTTMGLAAVSGANTAALLLTAVLGYIACFAVSVGPVTWIILSEIFPTRVRGRALATATVALWAANFVVSQTFPMLDQNPTLIALFHHGFPFFFYAFFCVVEALFVWKFLVETKNRTLEDISQSWCESQL